MARRQVNHDHLRIDAAEQAEFADITDGYEPVLPDPLAITDGYDPVPRPYDGPAPTQDGLHEIPLGHIAFMGDFTPPSSSS